MKSIDTYTIRPSAASLTQNMSCFGTNIFFVSFSFCAGLLLLYFYSLLLHSSFCFKIICSSSIQSNNEIEKKHGNYIKRSHYHQNHHRKNLFPLTTFFSSLSVTVLLFSNVFPHFFFFLFMLYLRSVCVQLMFRRWHMESLISSCSFVCGAHLNFCTMYLCRVICSDLSVMIYPTNYNHNPSALI